MKKNNPNLTNEQKSVLFEEGTEPPGSSELNNEKREGSYHCANCGVKLFESNTKYESGSGWPSFFQSLPDVFETKTDHLLGYARTEYHCKNCGGHHGHIFADGPQPTGKRYCNNGVCLVFKAKSLSFFILVNFLIYFLFLMLSIPHNHQHDDYRKKFVELFFYR